MADQRFSVSRVLENALPRLGDIDLGVVLVGVYFIFEFGSVQGLYPIVNELRFPFLLAIVSCGYAAFLVIRGRVNFKSFTTKTFFMMCLFVIVYSALSTEGEVARGNIIRIFAGVLANYVIITSSINKPSKLILFIDIWLLSIVFTSFHGIMQGGLVWGNRWMKDPNHISLVAATAVPFAFFLQGQCVSIVKRLFYISSLIFYISVNVIAASRGGALSMAVALFLCCVLSERRKRNFIMLLIAGAVIGAMAPQKFLDEMATLKQGTEEQTAGARVRLWKIGLRIFADHPVIGVGPLNHTNYMGQYDGFIHRDDRVPVLHSTPIQWIVEMGIVGGAILGLLQIAMYRNWRRTTGEGRGGSGIHASARQVNVVKMIGHACAVSQVAFWVAALFLSLMPYPFYWCLVPFSEATTNISRGTGTDGGELRE